jgi:EAL domain-containing protein (putative c-di-GMP-specific phosphodiesterase class I)
VRQFSGSHQVIFEVLESEGIENYDVVNSFIQEVKKYGVQIALDDFGAGYSNFAYITKLDIDYIKIDGSIIRDINTNPISQLITETIIEFATRLNIKTVAEFVCCEEVYNYLKPFKLDSMQGYYFGEPSSSMKE